MSKFLLNLLQISKALVNSKIQFLIQKFFSLLSAQPTPRPVRSLAQPAHWPHRPRRPKSSWHRSRLRGKYIFPFGSRLPKPAASPSSLCQPGPTYQIHPLPRASRPRSEIPRAAAPPRRCPAPLMAPSFYSPPSSLSPPLIPFKPSLNEP
jgi:hypothetical protein